MDGFHLGLIVNPLAGIGGAAALKGSDGVAEQALALGAAPRAVERTRQALEVLLPLRERLRFLTFPGPMGGDLLAEMGFHFEVIGELAGERTSAEDTRRAVTLLQDAGVALILFAGGDGTARDVAAVAREGQPVLGIPAGVKIHSGVYAVSPRAAGELARRLVEGGLVRLAQGEVRDLDEAALREGRVAARWYAELTVPEEGRFMQHVKQAGVETEELVLADIADWLRDTWEDGVRYVFGPGSTLHGLARELGLETTLLGVDVIENGEVIARDVTEQQLFELVGDVEAYPQFVPWITGMRTWNDRVDGAVSTVDAEARVGFSFLREKFATRVRRDREALAIDVSLLYGPFKRLANGWRFVADGEATRVEFTIDFAFKSPLLDAMLAANFDRAVARLMGCFEARAANLYKPTDARPGAQSA